MDSLGYNGSCCFTSVVAFFGALVVAVLSDASTLAVVAVVCLAVVFAAFVVVSCFFCLVASVTTCVFGAYVLVVAAVTSPVVTFRFQTISCCVSFSPLLCLLSFLSSPTS